MKTPEEIKEIKTALECCSHDECKWESYECPYYQYSSCTSIMEGKALSYINELEERIRLMIIQMQGDCGCCAYKGRPSYKSPCTECMCSENRPKWEYEGLPELKHDLGKGDEKP